MLATLNPNSLVSDHGPAVAVDVVLKCRASLVTVATVVALIKTLGTVIYLRAAVGLACTALCW